MEARPPTDTPQKRTYTVREAAQVLGITEATVRASIHRGEIPALKFGRIYRIAKPVIDTMERNWQPVIDGGWQ